MFMVHYTNWSFFDHNCIGYLVETHFEISLFFSCSGNLDNLSQSQSSNAYSGLYFYANFTDDEKCQAGKMLL